MLELALWKANLIKNDKEEGEHPAKKAKIADECGDTSAISRQVYGKKARVRLTPSSTCHVWRRHYYQECSAFPE